MKHSRFALAALLLVSSASCSKCSKTAGNGDAGIDASGLLALLDAGDTTMAVDAGAAPTPSAEPATSGTPTETGAKAAGGGPFAGSFKCNGGTSFSQNGTSVTGSNSSKMSTYTNITTYSCTVGRPDHCDGTATTTSHYTDKKKAPKEISKRKLYLEHRSDGDLYMRLEGQSEGTLCRKS